MLRVFQGYPAGCQRCKAEIAIAQERMNKLLNKIKDYLRQQGDSRD